MRPSTLASSYLHTHCTEALNVLEKQEIKNHKWVQANEPGTYLKDFPLGVRYLEPGDFNTVTVVYPLSPGLLCMPSSGTSGIYIANSKIF